MDSKCWLRLIWQYWRLIWWIANADADCSCTCSRSCSSSCLVWLYYKLGRYPSPGDPHPLTMIANMSLPPIHGADLIDARRLVIALKKPDINQVSVLESVTPAVRAVVTALNQQAVDVHVASTFQNVRYQFAIRMLNNYDDPKLKEVTIGNDGWIVVHDGDDTNDGWMMVMNWCSFCYDGYIIMCFARLFRSSSASLSLLCRNWD